MLGLVQLKMNEYKSNRKGERGPYAGDSRQTLARQAEREVVATKNATFISQYFNSTKAASKEDTSTVPAADAQVGPIDAQVGPADEYISPQVSAAVGTEDDGPLSESEEFLDDFRFGFEVAEMTRDALISALEAVSGMIGLTPDERRDKKLKKDHSVYELSQLSAA